jgi:hypothetical protein
MEIKKIIKKHKQDMTIIILKFINFIKVYKIGNLKSELYSHLV